MSALIQMASPSRQVWIQGEAAAMRPETDAESEPAAAVSTSKVTVHLEQTETAVVPAPASADSHYSPTLFQSLVFLVMEILLPLANTGLHLSYTSAIIDNTCVGRTLSEGNRNPTWTSNYYVLMLVIITGLSCLMLSIRAIIMFRMFRNTPTRQLDPAVLPLGVDKHAQDSNDTPSNGDGLSRWNRLYISWNSTSRRVERCSIVRAIVFLDTLLAESGVWFLSWYIPSEVHILSSIAIARTFLGAVSLAKVWGFESYLFLARAAACCIAAARPSQKSKCTYAGIYIATLIALASACAYPIVLYFGVIQKGIDGSYLNYQLRMHNVQCLMVDSLTNQTYWSAPVDTFTDTPDYTFIRATSIAWGQRAKYVDPHYHNKAYFMCPNQPQDDRNYTFNPFNLDARVSYLDLPFDIEPMGFLVSFYGSISTETYSNETGLSWDFNHQVKYGQSKSADRRQLIYLPIVFNGNSTIRLALGSRSLSELSSTTPESAIPPTSLVTFDLLLQTEWAKCSI